MISRHCVRTVLVACCTTLLMACDSGAEIDEGEAVPQMVAERPLHEQMIGLWEREVGSTTIGWLFKVGGVFQLGEPRPFFPVIGQWSVVGDTLQVEDPGCIDRASYRIAVGDDELVASAIDDTCGGRKTALEGTWRRFVYGE